MTYKLLYSTIVSVKMTECYIFRYVQPDWVAAKPGDTEIPKDLRPVKDPLPKISSFKAMYGSVTGNIVMQMISGLLLGGAVFLPDGLVVIVPVTIEGIPITGLIFGLILGVLTTRGVVKGMKVALLAPDVVVPEEAVTEKPFLWMPKNTGGLTALACVCVMVFSAVALQALMALFGLTALNIYQFAVFITIYANIVGKPLSHVLVRRCTQPDYIRYTLKKSRT